jgi:hypothetical protein
MGAVLGEQEVRRDGAQDDEADGITRAPETAGFGLRPRRVVVHGVSPLVDAVQRAGAIGMRSIIICIIDCIISMRFSIIC